MATTVTFKKFIPTTVFDLKVFAEGTDTTDTEAVVLATIDSLKIANFTQEGPTKTARGGKNNAILARYGKETRLEMEDAIISTDALKHLMGADVSADGGTIKIVDTFPEAVKLEGDTFFIDDKGEKIEATFTVSHFIPDGLFNLTMEAEGDFGVMEIGGEVIADDCGNFYTITVGDKYVCDEEATGDGDGDGDGGAA